MILFILNLPLIVQAQYLYYSDGSKFPLYICPTYVSVRFKSEIPSSQRQAYLSTLTEIKPEKRNRGLPNGFIGLPLKYNVNLKQLTKTLQNSELFDAIFPAYMGKDSLELLLYDEFLVRFKPQVSRKAIESFCTRHGVKIVKIKDVEPTQYTFRLTLASNGDPLTMANMFFDSLACEWAAPDFIVQGEFFSNPPTDPYFQNQYYLHNTGQEPIPGEGSGVVDTDIDALEAWDITKGNSNIIVAVIDEGVEVHEDLPPARILSGYDFVGYDRNNPVSDSDPSPDGNEAHGMAVAGIISSSHNSLGTAGIAPNCKILPVKIADYQGYLAIQTSRVADAVDFAWDDGEADVINGSWGYYTSNPNDPRYIVIRDAVSRAMNQGRNGLGTVCVFAAGNFADRDELSYVAFPANMSGVLAVGAIDKSNNIWYYSPKDSRIDVVAPSGNTSVQIFLERRLRDDVWSLEIAGQRGFNPGDYNTDAPYYWIDYSFTSDPKGDNYPPGNYTARFGGTSAAAPQAAGVAALILSECPELTQDQVVDLIKYYADDLGYPSEDQGSGRLNAYTVLSVPPSTPENFQVNPYPLGLTYRPQLTWSANDEPDLAGYLIERKIDDGSWTIPLNGNVSADATSFIDYEIVIWLNQNYQTAYYRMRAYDAFNLYSDYTLLNPLISTSC